MKKSVYKLFGLTFLEITRYEDEAEVPVKTEGGGEVLSLSEKEIKELNEK